jgi:type VI secretion system Hcp family effector
MIYSDSAVTLYRARIYSRAAALIFGCAGIAAASAATAPPITNTYITLTLPGVVGDFTKVPNAPPNAIQVLAMSTGASCAAPGNGCNVQDISISKQVDSASPALFLALLTGPTFYPTAVFNFWQTPVTGTSYTKTFTIYLTQASLSSVQNSASEGGGGPIENLSFRYQTIAFQDNLSGTVGCYNVTTKVASHSLTC